jgi:hypothetical protein
MTRSYSALTIVTIPRLSAAAAMTLGTALIAAARHEPALPAVFAPALGQLERELGVLRRSRRLRRKAQAIDPSIAVAADRALDVNWSGFHGFLVAWTKLANAPETAERAARAGALLEAVFSGGLRFLNLPYRVQWAESQTKLDRLAQPEHVEHVRALGGEAFVEVIARSHGAYGVALNVTKRKADVEAAVKVRGPLDAFFEALRSYVLRVSNYRDENASDEAARRLARALLEPLTTWRGPAGGRKGEAPEGEGGGPGSA